jgi:transcription elongation factor Elf1
MKLQLNHDIRNLLLGWDEQDCPNCGETLTFEEPFVGAPVDAYCEECGTVFDNIFGPALQTDNPKPTTS